MAGGDADVGGLATQPLDGCADRCTAIEAPNDL